MPEKSSHNAVVFDLFLAVETEFFLDFKLNGKTVSIPARLAVYLVALHGAVAGDHIFDDTSENVADVRRAVCCGGTIKEGVIFAAGAVCDAFFKDLVIFPELFRFLFARNEIHAG